MAFTVQDGDTATSIGQRLQQKGIIRNATLFELLAKAQNLQSQLRTGTYDLSAGMSMNTIMQVLIAVSPILASRSSSGRACACWSIPRSSHR